MRRRTFVLMALGLIVIAPSMVWLSGRAVVSAAQPPPDALVCSPDTNGGQLVNGVCVLPSAQVGQSYEGFILTQNNSGGTFSITAGSLPPGLRMPSSYGASGTIVGGTPTSQGTYTFTVQSNSGLEQTYSITVAPPPPLAISASCCTGGTEHTPYSTNLFSQGGAPPVTWSIPSGHLPPGLSLCPLAPATITGVPTAAGTFSFTLRATDSGGAQATEASSIAIAASSTVADSLSLSPTCVTGGTPSTGTITLAKRAPSGGTRVTLASNHTYAATVPSSLVVPTGATSATFAVATYPRSARNPYPVTTVTIQAVFDGQPFFAGLTIHNG